MSEYVEKVGGQRVKLISEDEKAKTITYWPVNEAEPDARITMDKAIFETAFKKTK